MNLKRTVILFLVVSLSIVFAVCAFADSQNEIKNEAKAQTLKALGLFRGSNAGFELDREPNRVEAGVMFVRLLGKEKEAEEMKYPHPFTDVPPWADHYIGYMYEKGYTKGIGNNLYGSYDLIQAESYITFILRALGYSDSKGDFTWSDPYPKATEIGLVNEETKTALKGKAFLRDDLVGISYDALNVYLKDTTTSLLEKLVEENAVSSDTAVEAGLIAKPWDGKTTITFTNFDNGSFNLFIDRSTLPENMRDFYKVTTGGIGKLDEGLFQLSLIHAEREGISSGNFNHAEPYDDEKGIRTRYYPDMIIGLFDKNGNRIGTALLNPVTEGTMSVEFREYKAEYPDDFEQVLKPFREMADVSTAVAYGTNTSDENNPFMYLYVDRTLLPESVRNYSGLSIITGGSHTVEETMYLMYKTGSPPEPSDREIITVFDQIKGSIILLYSGEDKIIGWAKIDENPKPSANSKLVELLVKTEYTDENLSRKDFSIKRYVNGSPDPFFYNKDDIYIGTERRIKEVNGEILNDCLIIHIGPYLKLDDSVRYEVTSDKVNIIEVREEKIR